jgi:hypothetical protein
LKPWLIEAAAGISPPQKKAGTRKMLTGALLGAPLTWATAVGSVLVDGLEPEARSDFTWLQKAVPRESPENVVRTALPLNR